MIWIRRVAAVFLAILFVPTFLLAILVLRVNDTFLSADFYVAELRKADPFNFLYNRLLPTALDEIKPSEVGGVTLDRRPLANRGAIALRSLFPPEWLQEQTELVIQQWLPYITGSTDEFSIRLPVADRLDTLGQVIIGELGEEGAYTLLFNDVVMPLADDKLGQGGDLPLGVVVRSQDLVDAVQSVFPPQWIQGNVEHVTGELLPYLAGERDTFAIAIPREDRIQAAVPATKELLNGSNIYNVLSNPEFEDEVEQLCFCDLSLVLEGVTLDDLLDTLGLDVTGLGEEQLEQLLPSAYTFCDTETYLPTCDTGLRENLSPDNQETLDDALDWTRNGFTYTDADLRDQFDDDQDILDRILDWTRDGFTYTDADLRDDLDADGGKRLDNLIRWNREGFTEADLRDLITDNGADPQAFENFDTIRSRFGLARSLRFLVYVELGLSLAAIGALGGRRWPSRIGWAAAVLGTAAVLVFITAGPLYGTVVESRLDNQFDDIRADMVTDGSGEAALLMMDKTLSVARTVADDFVSGVASRALLFLLLALAGLALAISWPWLFGRPRSPDEYGSEPPLDTAGETVTAPAAVLAEEAPPVPPATDVPEEMPPAAPNYAQDDS